MGYGVQPLQVIQMTGSRKPVNINYSLHGHVLETVACARYLVVDISSGLSWRTHIDRVTGSASKTLNFVRRNVKTEHPGVRELAYRTLVWPQLEYTAAVWDPHTKGKAKQGEKVHCRAAIWVSCNYERLASVSDMIATLGWRSLEQRRTDSRLCLFYKIIHGLVAVPLPDYIEPNTRISRYCHSMTFDNCKPPQIITNIHSFRLQLSSRTPCLNLLYACRALKLSRLQVAGCSILDHKP